jgi:uncharacterized protein
VFPWMGLVLLLITSFGLSDIFWLVIRNVPAFTALASPYALRQAIDIAAILLSLGLGIYALYNGTRSVVVKPVDVVLHRLPQSFDGFRIAQITDLHIGPMIDGAWLKKIVDQVNALNVDIIVVTGDLVDGAVADLAPHVAVLAELNAKHGVYFITGNHEYYSGADAWCEHVASLGLRVLRNERVTIARVSGDSFDLAGVDDWHSHRFAGQGANLAKALAGRDVNKPVVLLAHQPAAIDEAAQHGVDLQLSGHTHGGQIWPFNYLVYVQQPYSTGLHRHRDTATQIYTSAGTGFWGPPMRLGTRAEISEITLRVKI